MEKVIAQQGQNDHNQLPLIIEGKPYHWKHQYIIGAQIKELGGLPADSELFLSISNPWKDEPISNEQKVDLALPETEQFFVRKNLPYSINGVNFSSNKQYIKGAFIRQQGDIPADDDIFLRIAKDWEDELIENDELVDLARPGKEHFISRKFEVCIIVNLKEKSWNEKRISYEQVVGLAYPDYNGLASKSYTVKFTNGQKQDPDGSMSPGDIIYVKNKMRFNVTATNKS